MSNGQLVLLLLFCGFLALIPAAILGGIVYGLLYLLERVGLLKPGKPKPTKDVPTHKLRGWTAPPGWERAGYDLRRDVQ